MRRKRHKGAASVVARLARDPSKGSLYWFLWDEHVDILERTRTVGRQISWQTLLTDVQRLGLMNADGQPVTSVRTLQSTFEKVVADAKRQAAVRQPVAKPAPQPTNTPPPVVGPVIVAAAPDRAVPGRRSHEEHREWLQAEILRRSGKIVKRG